MPAGSAQLMPRACQNELLASSHPLLAAGRAPEINCSTGRLLLAETPRENARPSPASGFAAHPGRLL
eukprot:12085058-Alexandrium_andersonii.AAC.1